MFIHQIVRDIAKVFAKPPPPRKPADKTAAPPRERRDPAATKD